MNLWKINVYGLINVFIYADYVCCFLKKLEYQIQNYDIDIDYSIYTMLYHLSILF